MITTSLQREKRMSVRRKLGIWIDHRKAVIVIVSEKGEELRSIQSENEDTVPHAGGVHPSPAFGHQGSIPEDTRERRFANQLNRFYDEVISAIRTCGPYLLFGPGEAKLELAARLESGAVRGRIVGVETVDKMTDRQIAAKVRRYFTK
jgi:hypothetical protein